MLKGKGCAHPETAGRYAQKQQSLKESVIAHPSRMRAPKMDGAKSVTDIRDTHALHVFVVGRRSAGVEAFS